MGVNRLIFGFWAVRRATTRLFGLHEGRGERMIINLIEKHIKSHLI